MPTDLGAIFARKRWAKAQIQTDITMVSLWFIICLINLVLLFADRSCAQATIDQMGLY